MIAHSHGRTNTYTHTRHVHTHTRGRQLGYASLSLPFDSALYLQRYWSGASWRVSRFGLEPPIGQLVSILMHIVFFLFLFLLLSFCPPFLTPSLLGVASSLPKGAAPAGELFPSGEIGMKPHAGSQTYVGRKEKALSYNTLVCPLPSLCYHSPGPEGGGMDMERVDSKNNPPNSQVRVNERA